MSGAKPLFLHILELRAKGFYHLENFCPRSVNLTALYQLLQLKVAKSVILLSLLAHTLLPISHTYFLCDERWSRIE